MIPFTIVPISTVQSGTNFCDTKAVNHYVTNCGNKNLVPVATVIIMVPVYLVTITMLETSMISVFVIPFGMMLISYDTSINGKNLLFTSTIKYHATSSFSTGCDRNNLQWYPLLRDKLLCTKY